MKVLHVIHRYPPAIGGAEVWLREIARRLAARHGHELEIHTLALHEGEYEQLNERHALLANAEAVSSSLKGLTARLEDQLADLGDPETIENLKGILGIIDYKYLECSLFCLF